MLLKNVNLRIAVSSKCNMNCMYCEGSLGYKPQKPGAMEDFRKKSLSEGSIDMDTLLAIIELFHKEGFIGLTLTGGEPLLGWQRAYPELLDYPVMKRLKELTFETNGTQPLSKEFRQYLLNWTLNSEINPNKRARGYQALTFSVSVKLSCSGEKREDAVKPEIITDFQSVGHTYLKFVVATKQDVEEAIEVTNIFRKAGFTGNVYLMPAGGTEKHYNLSSKEVADLSLKLGLRYSPRMQIDLWGNKWGV